MTVNGRSGDLSKGVLDALHWCRLGLVHPEDPNDFHRAKDIGLLAQDPIWRTTIEGELALATARPEAYGRRSMAVECPTCKAQPYERCVGLSKRHRTQLVHSKRERAAAAPPTTLRPPRVAS